jgi:hypothetical protein
VTQPFDDLTVAGRKVRIPQPDAHVAEFMDVSMILWRIAQDHPESGGVASSAWSQLERWVKAAEVQVQRIADDHALMQARVDFMDRTRAMPGSAGTDWGEALEQAGFDAHFYFVCWENARKMFEILRAHAHVKGLREVYRKYRGTLERYSTARGRLEHLDERLPGQSKAHEMQLPNQPNVWVHWSWAPDGTVGLGGPSAGISNRSPYSCVGARPKVHDLPC